MNEISNITKLLAFMELIDNDDLTGEQKKERVISMFRAEIINNLGKDTWILQYENVISELIDFIVSISRKDININNVSKCTCFSRKKKINKA